MHKLLFFYLAISRFFRKVVLRIKGKSEADIHDQRVISGKAWEEFCDQLKLAGTVLHHPGTPRDAFNQAEGLRYLTRLTRAGLEAFVEFNDPAFPVLRRMVHETVKMGADNPDNYYFNAQISSDYSYRIIGKRNTVHYIGFFTQNGSYGTTGGLAPCGALEGSELIIEDDDSFEIVISPTKEGKNWLKLEEETSLLIVRQTFLNRFSETPAELKIEVIGGPAFPHPITPQLVDEGLKNASLFVAGAPLLFAKWAKGFQKHTNTLPQFDPGISNAAGGDANIIYYHSYWKLEPDEAMLVTVTPPACDSWNFQLNNYWMESLDYRYFSICVSKGTAQYESDGSIKVIIAHDDPGQTNWLDTCGHDQGTMCWRWYRIQNNEKPPQPECRVVKLKEINKSE